MNYHSSRKTPDSTTAHLHHAFNSPAAKSTPVLEVHHGQVSNDCHFIKLPLPSTPDSPPSAHQTSPQKYAWLDDQTNAYQFKDIINIEDTHPVIESQKKPSVKWASHRFPVSLVPSASRDTSTSAAHSPRQRQQYSGSVQVQRLRGSSLPRGKDMQAQYNTDVPVPCQLLDLSGSKISPKTKSSSAKSQRYENGGLRVHQEGTDHNTAAHAQWATLQRAKRNRSRQQGPSRSQKCSRDTLTKRHKFHFIFSTLREKTWQLIMPRCTRRDSLIPTWRISSSQPVQVTTLVFLLLQLLNPNF